MKHILERKDSFNCNQKITVIENDYEDNFKTVRLEIRQEYHEDDMSENEVSHSSYTFRDKKELSSFIGVLLHVQSKIK